MKVEQNKMVAVHYKLTVDGAVADQSNPEAPLEFICGMGMLLPNSRRLLWVKSRAKR